MARSGAGPDWKPPQWCAAPARTENAQLRKLVFQASGAQQGREMTLSDKAFYFVGRGDGGAQKSDIVLEVASVTFGSPSRWHCVICHSSKGDTFVIDLGSANGTFLNGQRIEPKDFYPWSQGETLEFGRDHGFMCQLLPRANASVIPKGLKRPLEESKPRVEVPHASSAAPEDGGRAANSGESQFLQPQPKRRQVSASGLTQGSSQPSIPARPLCGPELPPGGLRKKEVLSPAPAPKQLVAAAGAAGPKAKAKTTCDKCDGPHATEQCPHFKKGREGHKDAWANYGKKGIQIGSAGGNYVLRGARFVRQPGDGSCLFHSLCYGLRSTRQQCHASNLRKELALFIQNNPRVEISGDTLEEWVRWDANTTCMSYARRMAVQGWGGGIEMAVCSLIKKVNVHVYEKGRGHNEFRRISCFDSPKGTAKATVHVLYQGGVHYDALVPP